MHKTLKLFIFWTLDESCHRCSKNLSALIMPSSMYGSCNTFYNLYAFQSPLFLSITLMGGLPYWMNRRDRIWSPFWRGRHEENTTHKNLIPFSFFLFHSHRDQRQKMWQKGTWKTTRALADDGQALTTETLCGTSRGICGISSSTCHWCKWRALFPASIMPANQ